jgi:hypothetical protein
MRKLLQVSLTLLIYCNSFYLYAQQKFALVVGINKYYDKPGVLHNTLLHGCVNDAMSMKNLLLQQFGFNEKNIHALFDEQATKANLITALTKILANAKAGDAVVFYYSGHGSWMINRAQNKYDSVLKRHMNQAMVMSNLYADNLNCLVRDAELKKITNKFVDRGIVFTQIADCCYSGKIMLPGLVRRHNPYHIIHPYIEAGGRSLSIFAIIESYKKATKENDNFITDEQFLQTFDNIEYTDTALRSFNLKDALVVSDSTFITRPSERPHSMFLSLSASSDSEPALEETDETNTRHGIFTKTLIDAIKNNGPDMPVADLIKNFKQTFTFDQRYPQTPQHHEDPSRLSKNLLGIAPAGFRKNAVISVIAISAKKIILGGGVWSNLAAGNLLSSLSGTSKTTLRIIRAFNDSSEATVMNGSIASVKVGDKFMVTDNYAASQPLLKLFIGSQNFTPASFKDFMNKKILPLAQLPNYMDYENWYSIPSYNINFSEAPQEAEKNLQKIVQRKTRDSFVVMLPIPSYVAERLKTAVQKNQNIVLVNSAAEADYVLYLNYAQGKHPHFVFSWNHLMSREYYAKEDQLVFINQGAKTKTPELVAKDADIVASKITAVPNLLIRETSGHWLNLVPRR